MVVIKMDRISKLPFNFVILGICTGTTLCGPAETKGALKLAILEGNDDFLRHKADIHGFARSPINHCFHSHVQILPTESAFEPQM